MMLEGYATPEGTRQYADRFHEAAPSHFRDANGLRLSSIGVGTYLGDADDSTDTGYTAAIRRAVSLGCNVVDTAINYRCQRSERAIGNAIRQAVSAGEVSREEIFVSTKGGFIPFDSAPPHDPRAYFALTFVDTGILQPSDLVAGCHCLTPTFLEHQIGRSRENLGLETLDLYYLHNPETQLSVTDQATVYSRLRGAFETLEALVQRGWLRGYGIATWEAFRADQTGMPYLSMQEIDRLARQAGGAENHFRAVQLPVNLGLPEAFAYPNQPIGEETVPALAAVQRLGITAFASGSLHQGKLLGRIPPWLRRNLGPEATDAQRALQFARSCPGLTTALVGMARVEHVEENLALVEVPPLDLEELERVLQPPSD
jgi:aryl-alcohol dehydrogenase-like predicted oxidoreductase